MRGIKRDERTLHYAKYGSETYITDADGYKTGEMAKTYGSVKSVKGSLSRGQGSVSATFFGTDVQFDRVLITHDMSCDIDVNSIVWIDNATTGKHDYIVACKPQITPNCISVALKKVVVS